jgi:outer membrane protein assembly factor BamB
MSDETTTTPGWRRFTPRNILILGTILVTICWFGIRIDTGHRNMATASAVALTYVLLMIWFGLRAKMPAHRRWSIVLTMFAPLLVLDIKGCQGDLTPIIGLRWQPKQDYLLAKKIELPKTIASDVDLTKTTPQDYPRFLGPDGTARLSGVKLERDWGKFPPQEVWRRKIGAGWSSFAVVGDFVVTQEQRGDDEAVTCYRLSTGEPVWMHTDPDRQDTPLGGVGPQATPTVDRGVVYTYGSVRWLNALDGATGKPIWTIDVVKEFNAVQPDWGRSCSPLIVGDTVVVSIGGDSQALAAFDRLTGKLVWKAASGKPSYASPIMAKFGGVQQIVMMHQTSVTGHDPIDGHVLWTYDWPGIGMKVCQPIALDEKRLIVASGYGYGAKLLEVTKDGEKWKVDTRWESTQLNPKFMNPIVVGEYLYGLDDGVAMTCLDLATGKRTWKKGRYGHGQLLLAGELFIVQSEPGDVLLVEPNPKELREVAKFSPLSDRTWNNPVLVGEYLLVRNDREAACYRLKVAP